jgi:beta-glucanase (GH16 family)
MHTIKNLAVCLSFTLCFNAFGQCPTLVWADEFNQSSLDSKSWNFQIGDGCNINLCGWGNNELQSYQSANATVSNGTLKIVAKRENIGGKQFSSARIRTNGKVDIKFGRIESRMKMPIGQGLWPALWMLPTDNVYGIWPLSGEIDIMEYLGHEPNTIHGTLHFGNVWPNNQSTTKKYVKPSGTFNEDFHVYAMEWTDQKITWYIDGYLYATKTRADITGRWPFDQKFHFLLNMAVGGNWPGSPNSSTPFPQTFEIDYLRVYDKTEQPYLSGPESIVQGSNDQKFRIENPVMGSTYTWSVPAGATIASGVGTNTINVNWGNAGGLVKVKVVNPCGEYDYQLQVKAEGALQKKVSLENFDEEALITRGTATGKFSDNVKNPNPNDINKSALVGEYQRNNTSQFDILVYNTQALPNVTTLINGEEIFFLDVSTNAPTGTQVLLQLENSSRATSANYPTGRHSRFVAVTTKQNEWERLAFKLLDRPDATVSNTSVNTLIFLFASNTLTGHTYRFDNFDIYGRSLLSDSRVIEQKELILFPNPTNKQELEIKSDEKLMNYRIIDLNGKTIQSGNFDGIDYKIDIPNLSSGNYKIILTNDKGKGNSQLFIVVK